jgi:hypothetical protein
MLHELEHPHSPSIISKSGVNVRCWHIADMGVKRTSAGADPMSAFDLGCVKT